MNGAELLGLEEVLAKLEEKLGPDRVKQVVNKTLREAAKEAEQDLKAMAVTFNRTGRTVRQTAVGNVSWADYNIPRIKIGWGKADGDSPRWNIEHLNEMGFTINGVFHRPAGFGKLQDLVDTYETKYPKLAQEGLKELLE